MARVYITGANRGIGLALVKECLKRGDQVFAGARDPDGADELIRLEEQAAPKQLTRIQVDVAHEASICLAGDMLHASTEALDLLINNAGILFPNETLNDLSEQQMAYSFMVNTIGPTLMAKRCLPLLRNGQTPRIINISSEAACFTNKTRGGAYSYRSSKAALNMCTKLMGLDLIAENIIVVAVHPGWVKTDMGTDAAPLPPEASAEAILRLSDALTKEHTGKFLSYEGSEMPC